MKNAQAQENITPESLPTSKQGFIRGTIKYLLGKGIVSLGMMAAYTLAPGAVWPISAGFMVWRMMQEHDRYTGYQKTMLTMYRGDVAQRLGIPPETVTIEHLKKIANGDPLLGLPPNAIIAEALDRQRGISFVSILTSAIAATATFGLLSFDYGKSAGAWISGILGDISPNLVTHQDWIEKAGRTLISTASSLILHNGLDTGINHAMGHTTPTVHDRVTHLARMRADGKAVTPEQVFDVFLAANPTLFAQVNQQFNKGLPFFSAAEKQNAMQSIGIEPAMQQMAKAINKGELSVASLTFALDASQVEGTLKKSRQEEFQRTRAELRANGHGLATMQAHEPAQPQAQEASQIAPAQETSTHFQDMVGRRAANQSFVQAELQREQTRQLQQNTAPAV